eukprot:3594490-Rhodomonas_salina.2
MQREGAAQKPRDSVEAGERRYQPTRPICDARRCPVLTSRMVLSAYAPDMRCPVLTSRMGLPEDRASPAVGVARDTMRPVSPGPCALDPRPAALDPTL